MKVKIRRIKMRDMLSLTKIYLSLSEEIRRFFHPFQFKIWRTLPIFIYFSLSNKIGRLLKRIAPKLTVLSLVAVSEEGEIVGFAYLCKLCKLQSDKSYEAKNFGIIVREKYQGLGIGTKLMKEIIGVGATNGIRKMNLTVLAENEHAIQLYKKFGFKIERRYENREIWNGEFYPDYDMVINL